MGGKMPIEKLRGLIGDTSRDGGGFSGNLHEQAWDDSDKIILQMRNGVQ
jgi:hypothetical protein